MASINEDIQNIALDVAEPEPEPIPLNDLSSGRVASRLENPCVIQTAEVFSSQKSQNQESCSYNQIPSQPSSSQWTPSTSSGIRTLIIRQPDVFSTNYSPF